MSKNFIKRLLSSLVLLPLCFFVIIKGSLFFNFCLMTIFILICFEWHSMSKNRSYKIYGYLYFIISFLFIYLLRNDFNNSFNYFLLVILICISTDIGGYIFGKILKGPRLTNLSPKKTYSGMIGGFFLSQLVIILFFVTTLDLPILGLKKLTLNIELIFFIFLVSAISQIGDILISYFKRMANLKDTGKFIPGHGGLLDRFDGIILAGPFSYFLLKLNLFFP